MFTGIIETTGKIKNLKKTSQNIELKIEPSQTGFLDDIKTGSSISVNGVCLTVTGVTGNNFTVFISTETYNITNLKDIHSNESVNFEKALKLNDRLDGHIVMGHVDDTGIVTGFHKISQDYKLNVKIPQPLLKYVILKGSIAVNGISLTIANIKSNTLSFSVIPETYNNTNVPQMKIGGKVNIEVDMFAKYIRKCIVP